MLYGVLRNLSFSCCVGPKKYSAGPGTKYSIHAQVGYHRMGVAPECSLTSQLKVPTNDAGYVQLDPSVHCPPRSLVSATRPILILYRIRRRLVSFVMRDTCLQDNRAATSSDVGWLQIGSQFSRYQRRLQLL